MHYFYIWLMFIDFNDQKEKEWYLRGFVESYKKYQRIITYFYKNFFRQDPDGKKMIPIPYMDGKSWKVMKKDWGISPFLEDEILYFSNIKFIWDIPVYIVSLQKNWMRIYFIGVAVNDKIADEEDIVGEIHKKIADFRAEDDFKWAYEWVMDFSFTDNPIFYITPKVWYVWTTYIHGRKHH